MSKINAEDIRVIRYDLAMLRGLVQEICPQNEYIDAIIQMVDMDAIRQRGLHIILDQCMGSAVLAYRPFCLPHAVKWM